MQYKILPSLLAADILHLAKEVDAITFAGADGLHLDVMDNHYVPNLTFGPSVCRSLRAYSEQALIDVHLMTTPTDALIAHFADAGATRISIHANATLHLDRSLELIQRHNCLAGIVVNPGDSLEVLHWIQHRLDFVLIMTVNPGFGGQVLIPDVIEKIARAHEKYPNLPICVDGGIHADNIAALAEAGATEFVVGTALFHSQDYHKTILELREALSSSKTSR